ncbi:hypothetical protein CW304_20180 [Bacillus sp. UFRGS-B20]|nr:hypothetical protein CW304_20180 [Bacillus sp. UFRGS-B20]
MKKYIIGISRYAIKLLDKLEGTELIFVFKNAKLNKKVAYLKKPNKTPMFRLGSLSMLHFRFYTQSLEYQRTSSSYTDDILRPFLLEHCIKAMQNFLKFFCANDYRLNS